LFDEFGFRPRFFDRALPDTAWMPDVEIFQRDNRLIVRADLPGLKKDDVKVHVEENVLIIEGERKEESEVKKEGLYRSERTYGSFYRGLSLPEGVKADQIDASFKDGVLEITMPVEKAKVAKSIDVKVK
jgi:HSP20 family protein